MPASGPGPSKRTGLWVIIAIVTGLLSSLFPGAMMWIQDLRSITDTIASQ